MIALLDINVLLALLDASHVHHERARSWMMSRQEQGWASCPLTQNGFIRIITQPSYPGHTSVDAAISQLAAATTEVFHHFWSDDISLLDASVFDRSRIHGPKQITDAYLLALATAKGGCLVALDRSIPLSSVRNARVDNLVVL